MKAVKIFNIVSLMLLNAVLFSAAISAQTENPKTVESVTPTDETKVENQTNETKKEIVVKNSEETKPEITKTEAVPTPTPAVLTDEKEIEDAILPFYNNYLKEYRIGPNDVISVEVFGQCPGLLQNRNHRSADGENFLSADS